MEWTIRNGINLHSVTSAEMAIVGASAICHLPSCGRRVRGKMADWPPSQAPQRLETMPGRVRRLGYSSKTPIFPLRAVAIESEPELFRDGIKSKIARYGRT
jgi:hypothetical protein